MKKIFCILICALLLLTSSVLANDITVTAIGGSGGVGTLVDVRLIIESPITLDITYNSDALLLYNVTDTLSENASHGKFEDAYRLSWTEAEGANTVVLTFLVKPETESGTYAITVKNGETTKAAANVLVTSTDIKDITDDGGLTSEDSDYIAKNVVKMTGFSESISPKGDINGDGVVNLLDAILLARSVEGLSGYKYGAEREATEPMPDIESDYE